MSIKQWEYLEMAGADTEMRLWNCEGSHSSVHMVCHNYLKELGGMSVVRLVMRPLYTVIVVDGETFQAEPARSDKDMQDLSAVDFLRCHPRLVE